MHGPTMPRYFAGMEFKFERYSASEFTAHNRAFLEGVQLGWEFDMVDGDADDWTRYLTD
jgi:hypothetical protein